MKRKICIVLLITLLLGSKGFAQEDIIVLHIKGLVKKKQSGEILKTGSKIKSNEEILFSSKDDAVAVVSASKGKFVLTPKQTSKNNTQIYKQLEGMVSDYFCLSKQKAASRSGAVFNLSDLKKVFNIRMLVIGEGFKLAINQANYPMNDSTYFYVKYIYNNDTIFKVIEFKEDTIIFDRNFIYKNKNTVIDTAAVEEMQLFYYHENKETSYEITPFKPYFIDKKQLKKEIDLLFRIMEIDKTHLESVCNYISETYEGKIDKDIVNEWLNENY